MSPVDARVHVTLHLDLDEQFARDLAAIRVQQRAGLAVETSSPFASKFTEFKARHDHWTAHHPRPLVIDGAAYHHRRKARTRRNRRC